MKITKKTQKILDNYSSELPSVKAKLYNILMSGKLAGTGNLVILPVDQGLEHGPDRSFAKNVSAYDPEYHYNLAIDAELSAYAAPYGFLSACVDKFAGQIPTILKMNSNNSLISSENQPDQAITSSVKDALDLGCSAVGFTIYPGSDNSISLIEEAKEIIREAKSYGLASVIWSYPRGAGISKKGETAVDICAYAAHIAALIGAHIIKVKPPTDYIEQPEVQKIVKEQNIDLSTLKSRVNHVTKSCFNGKRLVVFSGGSSKDKDSILSEIKQIKEGGGSGSIIGRNTFQRERSDALDMLWQVCSIYKSNI